MLRTARLADGPARHDVGDSESSLLFISSHRLAARRHDANCARPVALAGQAFALGEVKLAALGPPVPITAEHDTSSFNCRHDALSQWLRRRALANASSATMRTYVFIAESDRVVGYSALAAGSLDVGSASSRLRRNMPDPLPVVALGRLAVDDAWPGRGIGSGLFKDAALQSLWTRYRGRSLSGSTTGQPQRD